MVTHSGPPPMNSSSSPCLIVARDTLEPSSRRRASSTPASVGARRISDRPPFVRTSTTTDDSIIGFSPPPEICQWKHRRSRKGPVATTPEGLEDQCAIRERGLLASDLGCGRNSHSPQLRHQTCADLFARHARCRRRPIRRLDAEDEPFAWEAIAELVNILPNARFV